MHGYAAAAACAWACCGTRCACGARMHARGAAECARRMRCMVARTAGGRRRVAVKTQDLSRRLAHPAVRAPRGAAAGHAWGAHHGRGQRKRRQRAHGAHHAGKARADTGAAGPHGGCGVGAGGVEAVARHADCRQGGGLGRGGGVCEKETSSGGQLFKPGAKMGAQAAAAAFGGRRRKAGRFPEVSGPIPAAPSYACGRPRRPRQGAASDIHRI
jgi:hypothetical protein